MRDKGNGYERVLDLIGKIYDTALDENLWATMSPAIAEAFDAPSAALQLRDARTGAVDLLSLTENYDAKSMASYEAYFGERDPWVVGALRVDMSTAVTTQDLMDPKELLNSEFYHDWCRPLGLFNLVGALLPIDDGQFAALGIIRPVEGKRFEAPDKALLSLFLPHLRRALQIRARLLTPSVERQAARETLDRTATATLVVSRDGQVLLANRKAEQLFREADAIRSVGKRLAAVGRRAADRLSGLIRDAADTAAGTGGSSGGTLALERPNRLPLTALVAPFRPARNGLGSALPAAILFVRDPEMLTAAAMALQGLFGLTPAEAVVASALAEGKSVGEIGAALGVSLNTARTHVKNILAKTGTSRQSQLVALLLRTAAVLVAAE
jgi:DNA-binding CsgD family transcriptional regulator